MIYNGSNVLVENQRYSKCVTSVIHVINYFVLHNHSMHPNTSIYFCRHLLFVCGDVMLNCYYIKLNCLTNQFLL